MISWHLLRPAMCVLLHTSDVSQSCTPLGRSLFTMTPISDHTLFIYGGVATVRNTLSKSQSLMSQHIHTVCLLLHEQNCASWATLLLLILSNQPQRDATQHWVILLCLSAVFTPINLTPDACHTESNLGCFNLRFIFTPRVDDAWQFNTQTEVWTKISHPHEDKPR